VSEALQTKDSGNKKGRQPCDLVSFCRDLGHQMESFSEDFNGFRGIEFSNLGVSTGGAGVCTWSGARPLDPQCRSVVGCHPKCTFDDQAQVFSTHNHNFPRLCALIQEDNYCTGPLPLG
jgi:hypothetical protein